MEDIEFAHYEDAKDIIEVFCNGIPEDPSVMDREEIEALAKEQGCWAFTDIEEGCIHVWFAPELPLLSRIEVFAHEITYMLMPEFDLPECKGDAEDGEETRVTDEIRCDLVAEIACIAYEKATELREV
jgi:hypothetical protein